MVQLVADPYGGERVDFKQYCVEFGRRVRALREERGFVQEDLMERGFSLRHFQRIEAGRSVTLRTIWKLAGAFSVDPTELLPPKQLRLRSSAPELKAAEPRPTFKSRRRTSRK